MSDGIRDVWASNLDEEMATIRELVERYPYVAMDTEFPGVVAKPVGTFRSQGEYAYQLLRANVDLLTLIQLGITFFDDEGQTPAPISTWQFNFKYSLSNEMFAEDSVCEAAARLWDDAAARHLQRSAWDSVSTSLIFCAWPHVSQIGLLQRAGIHFERHETEGIDAMYFAELLMTSGLVLNDDVSWITFHSGYDFGYLLALLTAKVMPVEDRNFFELLRIYFPTIYDIKYLMKSCKTLKGGLQELANELGVVRVGREHQAGSDAHVTGGAFFTMRSLFFEGVMDDEKFNGMIFGLRSH